MTRHILTCVTTALLWVVLSASLALSQTSDIDYDAWNNLADRAEDVLEAGRASDQSLEVLRSDLAAFRQDFLSAQDDNSQRIQTLSAQIQALGPAPEEGASEPDEIAQRRSDLAKQLATARAPGVRAEEAYTRADGLIREIDSTIRERQTSAVLDLGPSPLNFNLWPQAYAEVVGAFDSLWSEVAKNWASEQKRAELRAQLPLVMVLLVAAMLLLTRGAVLVRWLARTLGERIQRASHVLRAVLSFSEVVLPTLGVALLCQAALASQMVGTRVLEFVQVIPQWALTYFVIAWLANQTFSENDEDATIRLSLWRRREARFYFKLLALIIVLGNFMILLSEIFLFPTEIFPVLDIFFLIAAAVMLFRLGVILVGMGREPFEHESIVSATEAGLIARLTLGRMLGRGLMGISVVSPIMGLIGYFNFGDAILYPAAKTITVLAALLFLQRLANRIYQLITGTSVDDTESLVPVLTSFVLTLLALPFLAIAWGARVADLTELWTRFKSGFTIGETNLSPTDFLVFVLIFAIGYTATRVLQGSLRSSVLPKTKMDIGAQNAIVSGLGYVGIFVSAIIAVTAAGLDLSSLALVAGALSVGIGFGLQNIVQNFVSGIILLIERPISEGDWIEVGGQMGYVRDISVRSTRIETFDRTDVIVPNADLVSGTVTNFTRGNSIGRVIVPVGVAYGTDVRKVERILRSIARAHDMVLMNPEPSVVFQGFGADSLDFEIRAILRDVNYVMSVKSDMNYAIYEAFAKEGIEIPFAQRDLWLRNPEALQPREPANPGPAQKDDLDTPDPEDAGEPT